MQVPPHLYAAAAERVVGQMAAETAGGRTEAARRLISSAARFGIDLSLMWASFDKHRPDAVREVCLAIPGSGKTAMLYLSSGDESPAATAERAGVIAAACDGVAARCGVRLAQALLEPGEESAVRALRRAGFAPVGQLAYLRRPLRSTRRPAARVIPESVVVRKVSDLEGNGIRPGRWRIDLAAALECSYIDTLDCPELCGMRTTDEVIDSHLAVGRFDPALWTIVYEDDLPRGCVLLSPSPEQDSVELVYIGLGPTLRGRGLGAPLLARAMDSIASRKEKCVVCAVDTRNAPALTLYQKFGFSAFSTRAPLVKSLSR